MRASIHSYTRAQSQLAVSPFEQVHRWCIYTYMVVSPFEQAIHSGLSHVTVQWAIAPPPLPPQALSWASSVRLERRHRSLLGRWARCCRRGEGGVVVCVSLCVSLSVLLCLCGTQNGGEYLCKLDGPRGPDGLCALNVGGWGTGRRQRSAGRRQHGAGRRPCRRLRGRRIFGGM